MKLFIFVNVLDVGGVQVNAIELASALHDLHGFDVVLFATPGPMLELVRQKGLRFIPAPVAGFYPSLVRMKALRDAVGIEQPDILHAWEPWPCVEAFYGVHLPMRIPMIATDMDMDLARLLPKTIATTFGTPELAHQAQQCGYRRVATIVPPVDVHLNAPEVVDSASFRIRYGISNHEILLVTVSRIVNWLKGESLFRTIKLIGDLGRQLPLRFAIAGDGAARVALEKLARTVNSDLRRNAVIFTGTLLDPRPAYAAADIVIGMGGSALRGMAFKKPVVIVGENGFSAPLTPKTAHFFYRNGIYGRGPERIDGAGFAEQIRSLATTPDRRIFLGDVARQFVVSNFSLETVAANFVTFCQSAATGRPPARIVMADGLRTAMIYLKERRFLTRLGRPTSLIVPTK
jgi:glycosyltransferase involved in cell wall biosynthesis